MKAKIAMCCMALVALAIPSAFVGAAETVSYNPITNDADSGISSSNNYTHAIDWGTSGAATVNGVVFANEIGAAAGGRSNSGDRTYGLLPHPGETPPEAPPAVTGDVASVFTDFHYNGPDLGYVELTGLTAGLWYELRLYERAWDYQGDVRAYSAGFDVGSDDSVEFTTPIIDQSDATQSPPGLSGDVSYAMSYVYQADASGKIKIIIDLVDIEVATYHLYGLTNQAREGNYAFPLDGTQAGTSSTALGCGVVALNEAQDMVTVDIAHNVRNPSAAHINLDGGEIEIDLGEGTSPISGDYAVTPQQVTDLLAGDLYVNVLNDVNPSGDIRGQIVFGECPETPDLGSHIIPSSHWAIAGQSFSLTAPGIGPYQWSDGSGELSGATNQVLAFDPLEESDAGTYSVSFEDGSYGKIEASASYYLFVYPEGTTVPLTGLLGLGLLAGACAVVAASALRRKK